MAQLFGNNQMNNTFVNNQMNYGGNNNWRCGYSAFNNFQNQMINQNNNINNSCFQPQGQDNKINFIFKTSNGRTFNLLFNYGRTVEDLIHTFFKRVDQEDFHFHLLMIYPVLHLNINISSLMVGYFQLLYALYSFLCL